MCSFVVIDKGRHAAQTSRAAPARATYFGLNTIIAMPKIMNTGALRATPTPNRKLPAMIEGIVLTD